MFRPQQIPVHPEDKGILEIASQLCWKLGVNKLTPRTVAWVDRLGIRRVPVDFVLFFPNQLRISRSLMGKLQPEQWEAYLATNLIYQSKMRRKMATRMLTRTFAPFFAVIIGGILIFDRLLALQGNLLQIAISLILITSIVVLAISYIGFFRYLKQLVFEADSQASTLVGTEKLRAALQTLDSIQGIEGTRAPRFGQKPSISARLDKLNRPGYT